MSGAAPPAPLALDLLPGAFAVCRLEADAPVPAWGLAAPFSVVARTTDELAALRAPGHAITEASADPHA